MLYNALTDRSRQKSSASTIPKLGHRFRLLRQQCIFPQYYFVFHPIRPRRLLQLLLLPSNIASDSSTFTWMSHQAHDLLNSLILRARQKYQLIALSWLRSRPTPKCFQIQLAYSRATSPLQSRPRFLSSQAACRSYSTQLVDHPCKQTASMSLMRSTDPLVWIDCEVGPLPSLIVLPPHLYDISRG